MTGRAGVLLRYLVFFLLVFLAGRPDSLAQELPATGTRTMEELAAADAKVPEDDQWWQDLEQFRRHPLSVNSADRERWHQLRIFNDLEIDAIFRYRERLGLFRHVYELQAVPGLDQITIRAALPFLTIGSDAGTSATRNDLFRSGGHRLLIRVGLQGERTEGYDLDSTGRGYTGGPERIYFQYRYRYSDRLRLGITADKDAGEPFFNARRPSGFDFYSAHFFMQRRGFLRKLALGDFTVNLGQGLVFWQGLAFGKTEWITSVKRQSPVLSPYTAAGETLFCRGIGVTVGQGSLQATFFFSRKRETARIETDSLFPLGFFSSVQTGGLHRTVSELSDRKRLGHQVSGLRLAWRKGTLSAGIHGVVHRYSLPLVPVARTYNLHAFAGRWARLAGLDYQYTWRNVHVFGEFASDARGRPALMHGLLMSLDHRCDWVLLYRNYTVSYRAIDAAAFGETGQPWNERGLYIGWVFRIGSGMRFDAYLDNYRFPWLRYRVGAPSVGREFLFKWTYTPQRGASFESRVRVQWGERDGDAASYGPRPVAGWVRFNWQAQVSYRLRFGSTVRSRVECSRFHLQGSPGVQGFLWYTEWQLKPVRSPLSGQLRFQYFETDGYDARIYAYETDVAYSFSIPAFSGTGIRHYVNLRWELLPNLKIWARFARTRYFDRRVVGDGLDRSYGPRQTEFRFQLEWQF